ncbi:BPSL0761 family protein [Pseudomonas sp. LS-2]|uniref:BPSL0761 family protein n=1 Tax=Pseudomonas sp. LS-2 TaxID=2315859 RepID=UPI00273FD174|nr:BPSL0761 family protein [Pseudomonas sp. LS-2]
MTSSYERTRSVIETGSFLAALSRDTSLPDDVREQARQLLRHYPTAESVRLAGRCEEIRQAEVLKLPGSPGTLHPALATWPLLDTFFCDSAILRTGMRLDPALHRLSMPCLNCNPSLAQWAKLWPPAFRC